MVSASRARGVILAIRSFARFALIVLPVVAQAQAVIDPAKLERFADSQLPGLLKSAEVPGAVVIAVQSGRVIFRKGYGVANVETRVPMDPGTTIVRIASVSKPFTALLAMQLVQSRRIGLDDDVAPFLGTIHIRNAFPKRVTLRHLLTHSAGLDKVDIGRFTPEGRPPVPLETYLRDSTPPVVRMPGEIIAYSNHGFALAGQIVANLRGCAFSECARRYLFEPLGMNDSSFEITPQLRARMATGYRSHDGRALPMPVDLVNTIPASMMVTTADDFAKFLRFILSDPRYVSEVQRAVFKNHDALPQGYGYGLFVDNGADGSDWLWHTGDFRGWSAEMGVYPAAAFGIFMAFNSDDGGDVSAKFIDRLRSQFFKFEMRAPHEERNFARADLSRLSGNWGYVNDAVSSNDKVERLFDDGISISHAGAQALIFEGHRYAEIAPLVFRRADDPRRLLAFPRQYAATGIRAYRRLSWYERGKVHRITIGVALAMLMTQLVRPRRFQRLRWRVAGLVTFCFLAFVVGMIANSGAPVRYGFPVSVRSIRFIAAVGAVISVSLPFLTLHRSKHPYDGWVERSHYALVSMAALVFSFELLFWRLIG